jgi:hypothetical protein
METNNIPFQKAIPIKEAQNWFPTFITKAVLLTTESQSPDTPYILLCGLTQNGDMKKYLLSSPDMPNLNMDPSLPADFIQPQVRRNNTTQKKLDTLCFDGLRNTPD